MGKIWAVIRREFVERVRTKAFIIGTVLGPIFFIGLVVIPGLLLNKTSVGQRIAVVDATTGEFGQRISTVLAAAKDGDGAEAKARYVPIWIPAAGRTQAVLDSLIPRTGLPKKVDPEAIDGILVVDESGIATGKLSYYGANVGSMTDMSMLQRAVTPLVITERLRRAGVEPAVALGATTPVDLETRKVTQGKLTGESGGATFALAYAMGIILYMALLLYGTQVMTSIIEEKSNRIIEVLVSSLTPFQMMLGKVLGVGLVSLVQITIWGTAALLLSKYKTAILGFFGVKGAAAAGGLALGLPSMEPALLAVFLLFFVLGFLLYSSAYAAVGSMCNTVQDTQQAQMPIMMSVLVSWFSTFALLRDPGSTFAKVAGFIPFMSPFVIPVRYSLSPIPIAELVLAAASTILGLLLVVWVASRIYRTGILMYGKRASLKDVVKWVRAA